MWAGLVSQHPPKIVAPASLKVFTNSDIFSGVKSSLLPKNSFGLPVLLWLKVVVYPALGLVVTNPFSLKPNGTPRFFNSSKPLD